VEGGGGFGVFVVLNPWFLISVLPPENCPPGNAVEVSELVACRGGDIVGCETILFSNLLSKVGGAEALE